MTENSPRGLTRWVRKNHNIGAKRPPAQEAVPVIKAERHSLRVLGRGAASLTLMLLTVPFVSAQSNAPPEAIFNSQPAAGPARPGDLAWSPGIHGTIQGVSPLTVTFNMCRSTDPDEGDQLRFLYDFDGDGIVDFASGGGGCRASHTYRSDRDVSESRGFCQLPENAATVCVSDRQPFDGHTICRRFVVCARPGEVGTAAPSKQRFVYIADSRSLTVHAIGPAGGLTPVAVSSFATPGNQVVVHPTGMFLYVTGAGAGIHAFEIDGGGVPSPMSGSPFAPSSRPSATAIDPTGTWFFATDYLGQHLSTFRISADGSLLPVGTPTTTSLRPYEVVVHPTRPFVYVSNELSADISVYSLGAGGVLTEIAGSPFATGSWLAYGLDFDPSGSYLYLAQPGVVSAYAVADDGTLTPLPGSPFAGVSDAAGLVVDPTGSFVIVANVDVGVSVFSIGAGGTLSAVAGSPFPSGQPVNVAVDPDGPFVYVTNPTPGDVSGYLLGPSGDLSPLVGSPFPVGIWPLGIAITP